MTMGILKRLCMDRLGSWHKGYLVIDVFIRRILNNILEDFRVLQYQLSLDVVMWSFCDMLSLDKLNNV